MCAKSHSLGKINICKEHSKTEPIDGRVLSE